MIDQDKFPLCAKAHKYAEDVIALRIPACKWVRLAAERYLRDLERAQAGVFKFKYDPEKAEKVCRFAQLLPHNKGKWARKDAKTGRVQRLVLEGWQCFIVCNVYGWVNKDTGFRRFTQASIYVPRKNGKSMFACVLGWWMFAKDKEPGAEVYCGATSEAQAWEVFRPARQTGIMEPELPEALGVKIYGQTMVRPADGSRFEPVIGKPGDGASPHCAIVDEYHNGRAHPS
jgi:phage terminase large subunit-like protein